MTMSTLHIVSKSPENHSALSRSLVFSSKGDSILLIEDGVYCALSAQSEKIYSLNILNLPIYALKEDILARGISNLIDDRVQTVTYDGFVELTETHSKSTSWF